MLKNRSSQINAPRQKRGQIRPGSGLILGKAEGQSTVEYIILVSAVIAVILVFVNGQNSPFQTTINNTYTTVYSDIDSRATVLSDSHNGLSGADVKTTDIQTDYSANVLSDLLP